MICPDCELEVEKLTRAGICKQCGSRKANAKYYKKEYVKLKDIKDSNEYKRVLAKRNSAKIKKSEQKKKEITEDDELKQKAKEVVEKDIEDKIEKLNIERYNIKIPFNFVIECFTAIFDQSIIKDKMLLRNEYDVLITDRLHKLMWTDDVKELQQIALEQKYIQEYRSKLKQELKLYEPFKEIIISIMQDEILNTQIQNALSEYKKIKKEIDNPLYITNTLSMQNDEHVKQVEAVTTKRKLCERKPMQRWYASVPCYNLYGNPEKSLFEAKDGIVAVDEAHAKDVLKHILSSFNNISYNDKDIVIREFSLEKE